VEVGAYVGGYKPEAVEAVNQVIEDYKANPSREAYEAINRMLTSVATIEVEPNHWYRLRNVERSNATLYLTPETSRFTAAVADKADADQVFQFVPTATDGQYYLYNGNYGLYLGKLGANETQPTVGTTTVDAGVWSIVASPNGKSQVLCNNKTGANPGLHLAGDNVRIVPWTADAPASLWYIEPVTTYEVNVPAEGYASVNLPFAVSLPEGATAYVAIATANVEGVEALVLEEVKGGVVPANTPVVLTAETGKCALEVVYPAAADHVTVTEGWGGTLKAASVNGNVFVVSGEKMVKNTAAVVPANQAYYLGGGTVDSYALIVKAGEETGINGVTNVNGQVKLYDLNGRRVLKPGKGIYITEDGKKLLF